MADRTPSMLVLKCFPAVRIAAISSFRLVSVFWFASLLLRELHVLLVRVGEVGGQKKKPTRMMPRVKVTKMSVKKEIWKLKIFFSEWGMSMTVNRCFPLTMTYLKKLPREPKAPKPGSYPVGNLLLDLLVLGDRQVVFLPSFRDGLNQIV